MLKLEKELLAFKLSLKRFKKYAYGNKVHVESDHKPLEIILKKPLATAPPRLQRSLLRMQKYDYTQESKPRRELVLPDMLSRAPLPDTTDINNMERRLHYMFI